MDSMDILRLVITILIFGMKQAFPICAILVIMDLLNMIEKVMLLSILLNGLEPNINYTMKTRINYS